MADLALTRGHRVIRFIERYCYVPEGALVGQPLVLDEFQRDFILRVYDNPAGTRTAYLSIARKNAKSTLIAALILAHLVGPEAVQNAQLVSGAMSRDQAALVFALAVKMINMNSELQGLIHITPSGKKLRGLPMNTEFRALAAEGKTAHGLSPVLAILDEIGQVVGPQDAFIDAITTSQAAHETPLLIAISTQAASDTDLFSVWLDDAETSNDPHIVSVVYAADESADVLDEAQWRKANPALGKFRSFDEMKEAALKASRMPSFENTFRNLYLNQRISTVSAFISRDVWTGCGAQPDELTEATSEYVYVGLDLSARTDLTAAVIISGSNVRPLFWMPEQGLMERAKRDRAPYDVWVRQGYLLTTPGATVDYGYVAKELAERLAGCTVVGIAFDRWRIDIFRKECEALGIEFPLTEWGQGFRDMSPAIDALEAALLNKELRHGAHPVLTMCAANAIVIKDAAGNRKLDKSRGTGRIDGLVALAMALGLRARDDSNIVGLDDYLDNLGDAALTVKA